MQSLDMLHNIVQFDVAGADSLRISMILLCCYIIYIANLYFICSTVQFDVAGDEWRDVLKERIMDQVMFLLKFYFLQKFKYLLLFYNDNLWWQQFMTKTIYVWHFTDREILYAGRLCPLLQRGDNQIFLYEERNITNSLWNGQAGHRHPHHPPHHHPHLHLHHHHHPQAGPDGFNQSFSSWIASTSYQDQIATGKSKSVSSFFQHFINNLYLCLCLYLHFVCICICICIEILFPGWSGSARSLTRRSPSSKTSWMSVIVIVIVV